MLSNIILTEQFHRLINLLVIVFYSSVCKSFHYKKCIGVVLHNFM